MLTVPIIIALLITTPVVSTQASLDCCGRNRARWKGSHNCPFGCLGSDSHGARSQVGFSDRHYDSMSHILGDSHNFRYSVIFIDAFKFVRPWVSICYWKSHLRMNAPGRVCHLSSRSLVKSVDRSRVWADQECGQLQGHLHSVSMVPSPCVRERFGQWFV